MLHLPIQRTVSFNVPETLRAKCLKAFQLLRRLEESDDNGFCECVTCGEVRYYKTVHGGHFLPKGKSSFYAFDSNNVWPQCPACNLYGMKHGSAAQVYTLFMIRNFGKDHVDNMLANQRTPIKLYAKDYRDMLSDFNARIKIEKKRIGVL